MIFSFSLSQRICSISFVSLSLIGKVDFKIVFYFACTVDIQSVLFFKFSGQVRLSVDFVIVSYIEYMFHQFPFFEFQG